MLRTEQQLLHPPAASLSNVLLKAGNRDLTEEAQENHDILSTMESRKKDFPEGEKKSRCLISRTAGFTHSTCLVIYIAIKIKCFQLEYGRDRDTKYKREQTQVCVFSDRRETLKYTFSHWPKYGSWGRSWLFFFAGCCSSCKLFRWRYLWTFAPQHTPFFVLTPSSTGLSSSFQHLQ